MGKFALTWLLACVLASLAGARPAEPGVTTVENSDGSLLSILQFGDEHYHFFETEDGYLVTEDGMGGYVYVDERGAASGYVAKDAAYRTDKEKAFLKGLDQEAAHKNFQKLRGGRFPGDSLSDESDFAHTPLMAYNQKGVSALFKRPVADKWTTGERWFPVLLIGTTDKPHGDSADFYDFLNKPGYSENKNIGSLRDYFLFVSDSLFNPHFDVYPIDLNVTLVSFGRDSSFNEGKFVATGLDALVKRSDFKENARKYCFQNSNVDGFIFLFPGTEKEAMQQSDLFWAHSFRMSANGSTWNYSAYRAGGFKFDRYAFLAQIQDRSDKKVITRMGTFAHEFSHVMGLRDHYAKDANGKQINGPGYFDLMSQGMYNGFSTNSGDVPMGYSAFEKEWMGWLTLEELQPDSVYSLKKLSEMQAYSVTNPNQRDEYYIVEYRPSEKYDAKVRADIGQKTNGVYVWYIDYDETAFIVNNKANGDLNHQRVALNAVLGTNGYYVDFLYVNKNGVSSVPGIYNMVFDGNDRACFTTAQNIPLSQCPVDSVLVEESSSSESSSSFEISSSSVEESSSSEEPQSSSSESVTRTVADGTGFAMSQVQMSLNGRTLNVFTNIDGLKKIRLFDLQGRLLHQQGFSEKTATVYLNRLRNGSYVVRVGDAEFSESRKIVLE